MKITKRGQAALEFLMTYGWAILVVLVVIGALAYFGVLNPTNLVAERCTLQQGIGCEDFAVDGATDNLNLLLSNQRGEDICVSTVTLVSAEAGINCVAGGGLSSTTLVQGSCAAGTHLEIPANSQGDITYDFGAAPCGINLASDSSKNKFDVGVVWYEVGSDPNSFSHTNPGTILSGIE